MPEEEPRYDLAGNLLPPLPSAPPLPPGSLPPLRPAGPASPPRYQNQMPGSGSMAGTPGFAPPEPDPSKLRIGLSLGGMALVLVIAAVIVLTPKHTSAPLSYTKYTAADQSFSCLVPSGWTVDAAPADAKMSDGSTSTVGGALIHQNSASIDITTDTYATLTAYDVMNNNADPQSLTGSKAGALHKQWHKRIAAEHKGYAETQISHFEGRMGDARLAEWTASGNALGFGGLQHGYRASVAGGGKTAVIVCSCLEADWPALKPAFRHVLGSLTVGDPSYQEPLVPSLPQ